MENAILAAMQQHPKDRPESVDAWRAMLGGAPANIIPALSPAHSSMPWGGLWAQTRWFLLAAALFLLMAALLTFFR